MSLFTHTLDCMIDNNDSNNANFSEWFTGVEAVDFYKTSYVKRDYRNNLSDYPDISDEELDVTIKALDMIIRSNGKELQQAKDMFNAEIKELIK